MTFTINLIFTFLQVQYSDHFSLFLEAKNCSPHSMHSTWCIMNFSKLKIVFNILHMFQHLAFHHFSQTFFYSNHNLVSRLYHKMCWSFLTSTTISWSCYNTRGFLFLLKKHHFSIIRSSYLYPSIYFNYSLTNCPKHRTQLWDF